MKWVSIIQKRICVKQGKQKVRPSTKGNKLARLEKNISEFEAKSILSAAGIPANREFLTQSCEEAIEAQKTIGGPVVLKVASPDVLHKPEIAQHAPSRSGTCLAAGPALQRDLPC